MAFLQLLIVAAAAAMTISPAAAGPTMMAPGAPGGGGDDPGNNQWTRKDTGYFDTEEISDDSSEDEGEDEFNGIRWCRVCSKKSYLRKGACANPRCVLW